MAYVITDTCIGCTLCAKKCPVGAIAGEAKRLHHVHSRLCIDCGVCGSYCPSNSIYDNEGRQTFKLKERPVAVVDAERCSGCNRCVDVCPTRCLEMVDGESGTIYRTARNVRTKDCVACRMCETVCGDKGAIKVRWSDGEPCYSLNRQNGVSQEVAVV